MHVCVYVCGTYIRVRARMHARTYVWTHVCMYVGTLVRARVWTHVCTHAREVDGRTHVCVYVCYASMYVRRQLYT